MSITFLLLRCYGSRVDNRKKSILTYERRQLRRQETFPTELLTPSSAHPREPWKVLMGEGRAHQGRGSTLLGCILFFQLISSKAGELAQWLGCTALEAPTWGSWLPVIPVPEDLDTFFWTLWTPAFICAHNETQTHAIELFLPALHFWRREIPFHTILGKQHIVLWREFRIQQIPIPSTVNQEATGTYASLSLNPPSAFITLF